MWFAPYNFDRILVIDPKDDSYTLDSMGANLVLNGANYLGMHAASNGLLYSTGWLSTNQPNVLEINPFSQKAQQKDFGGLMVGTTYMFSGIVEPDPPDGYLYAVPHNRDLSDGVSKDPCIAVLDPGKNTVVQKVQLAAPNNLNYGFFGAVVIGVKIYLIPCRLNSAQKLVVPIYNTSTKAWETPIDVPHTLPNNQVNLHRGGCLGADGKIYAAPYYGTDSAGQDMAEFTIIDPISGTGSRDKLGAQFNCGIGHMILANDQKIYGSPIVDGSEFAGSNNLWNVTIIDPDGKGSQRTMGYPFANSHWSIVQADNGYIYSAPGLGLDFVKFPVEDRLQTTTYGGGRIQNIGLLIEPGSQNLFLDSNNPETQTVPLTPDTPYTVSVKGTGSVALSSAATGTALDGSPVSFTSPAGTPSLTFTVNVLLTHVHVEPKPWPTSPIVTTATQRLSRLRDVPVISVPGLSAASAYAVCIDIENLREETQTHEILRNRGTANNRFAISVNTTIPQDMTITERANAIELNVSNRVLVKNRRNKLAAMLYNDGADLRYAVALNGKSEASGVITGANLLITNNDFVFDNELNFLNLFEFKVWTNKITLTQLENLTR